MLAVVEGRTVDYGGHSGALQLYSFSPSNATHLVMQPLVNLVQNSGLWILTLRLCT